jgi:hypothetical protein
MTGKMDGSQVVWREINTFIFLPGDLGSYFGVQWQNDPNKWWNGCYWVVSKQ